MVSSGYKKTPVPNRGFVPGRQKPYSFIGPENANVRHFNLIQSSNALKLS